MDSRGITPVIGLVLLVALTVILAATILHLGSFDREAGEGQVMIEGTVDPSDDRITLEHAGGDSVSVTDIDIRIIVDDRPLKHQPPVPFTGAAGYDEAPSGPFNSQSSNTWNPGERASLSLAGTNEPLPTADSTVVVRISSGETVIAEVTLTHVG